MFLCHVYCNWTIFIVVARLHANHVRSHFFIMKRPCSHSPEGGRRAAAMVSLNVGGKHFDSSPDTLIQAQYFEPYLRGRLQHSADPRGRLFVDRDPELFAVLLQFLRGKDPSTSKLRQNASPGPAGGVYVFSNSTPGTSPLRSHVHIRPPFGRPANQGTRVRGSMHV